MADSYLKVSDVDFDDIRNNLKTFLTTQTQFRDYDFEGSNLSVLLDVLAYNTHYNAFYLNMLANEMFLDTAQQRDSIASLAKMLGYVSTSAQGPTAQISMTFSGLPSGTTQFTIAKNSKFNTTIDDITYTFVTPKAYTVIDDNGFEITMDIKEGYPLVHKFTHNSASPVRFVIPNKNVDTSSIVVKVQESADDTTTTEWVRATNIKQVFETSEIYFVEEAYDEKYEIIFGSGSLGKSLTNGNIVIVEYLVCNGDVANGAKTFSTENLITDVQYGSVTAPTTVKNAIGGRFIETPESVKFNAPRHFQTQNRAIIAEDYKRIVLAENSDLESVVSFGGENADPPIYGKVFIAVKPFGEQFTTESRKALLKNSIVDRTPLSIDPVIIDPEYTYVIANINTYYDSSTTKESEGQIRSAILTAISNFSTNNLERFGQRLRFSKFLSALDAVNVGKVLNNDAKLSLQKRVVPNVETAARLLLKFANSLKANSLLSSRFVYRNFECFLDDDGQGNVRIYRFDDSKQKVIINATAGTINYNTGTVDVPNFAITSYDGIELYITCETLNLDVDPVREQILIVDPKDATVSIIDERLR
jgi:hypothetical protein